MDKNNVQNLNRNGFIVWLKGDAEVLKERMEKEQRSGKIRPSLTGIDPLEEINQVLNIRIPLYQQTGNLMVDTGILSIEEVADTIIENLPSGLQD
jgi:shikimate kinase